MFEITGDDIATLSDEDLRTLVARLCEAEVRRRQIPTSCVTWGGNQTATDGGLDVRVALISGASIDGFIPTSNTGFQVKKSRMNRAAIVKEMVPKGNVRPTIVDLAATRGAYVIVSSGESTSDSALASRRAAMREAVRHTPNGEQLTVEFYDRNRIATWVRDHVGLIPWIRSRINRSIPGWRGHGSWSHTPDGADATYLLDDTARIRRGDIDDVDGLSAVRGIEVIRTQLQTPGHVVRLVGLSGVGKTRFAEALFDPAVGANSLDSSIAIYADIADEPSPPPFSVAADLIARGARAILIIDNCPPDIHRRISEVVRMAGTTVSAMTVEYDIRDDQPEGTDVFSLDTSSATLIETLVSKRFPTLSHVDCRTVAEFSGGNARIALALAGTVGKSETIAGLNDAELHRRLFQQRNSPDASLQAIAEVCSLVYSFEGEAIAGEDAELPILASLARKSPDEVFQAIAELRRRDLLQHRGPWRAVLPQAIANRLAATALQNIPTAKVLACFETSGRERLLRSFSRRLGYLHRSREARTIVEKWLQPDGLVADVADLNDLGRAVFFNVAPVLPDAALSALERAIGNGTDETVHRCMAFVPLLRSLAYESDKFERAVPLLVKFARRPRETRRDDMSEVITTLFHIILSGTHASLDQRLKVADGLLRSTDTTEQNLGIKAVEGLLKTGHFSSSYEFEFGARSRDYGYHPKTQSDVRRWFSDVLKFVEPFAISDSAVAEPLRTALARAFRSLWTVSDLVDDLERLSGAIAARHFWREGWQAARETRLRDGGGLVSDVAQRLAAIEELLRPKDLVDRVRGVVLGTRYGRADLDFVEGLKERDHAKALARAAATAEQLGRDLAADGEAFQAVLPELIAGGGRVTECGRGLAMATDRPREVWSAMVSQLASTGTSAVDLLGGFLEGLQVQNGQLANALLDEVVDDATLCKWLPALQRSAPVDERALARLHSALANDAVPIESFFNLAYGQALENIVGEAFKRLLVAIAGRDGGLSVAMESLSMRFHMDSEAKRPSMPEAIDVGRELLEAFDFTSRNERTVHEDHAVGLIIRRALADDRGKPIARRLCRQLMKKAERYDVRAYDYADVVASLFKVHPTDVLDELFVGDKTSRNKSVRLLSDIFMSRDNALATVPDDTIIGWCDADPAVRYPVAAATVLLFKRQSDQVPHEWTTVTRRLLEKAPDPDAVLSEIVARLQPRNWAGSLATKLESRLQLLTRLDISNVPGLEIAFELAKARLSAKIAEERRRESEENRSQGSFE